MILRAVGAVAVLVSAFEHLRLWSEGYRYLTVIGPAFMVNVVAGVVIAVLIVAWRHWVPLLLTAGFGLATLGAFVVATTVGLFGVHDQWVGGPVWISAISEAVAILAGLGAALSELRTSRRGVPSAVPERQ